MGSICSDIAGTECCGDSTVLIDARHLPYIPVDVGLAAPEGAYRVLITGFGPFASFAENPSWLAVQKLHNRVLDTAPRPTHITVLEVPTAYATVLRTVPGLHARPPVLPPTPVQFAAAHPPRRGYDLVLHVGVGRRGAVRLEKLAHKHGYDLPDAEDELAPSLVVAHGQRPPRRANLAETVRLEGTDDWLTRGFGEGYEGFPEEIHTAVDVDALVAHLRASGVEHVEASTDAGRYLCDFIYYCSLAESHRSASTCDKPSQVLFVHCPPNDELPSAELAEILERVVIWVGSNA